ncbi:monocarboxylate permease [Scheffersomyces amazonensis]|uniref:monocarboxylate permease n=1 Tax=Scheffersomyces amazonensis TaxID=1078765 RepID=UPI00315D90A0
MHKKTFLHRISHKIRHYLSHHFSVSNLKRLAFLIALIACLSSGSILLFSLFSTSLHEVLGLSYLQINFIASLSAIGMYLCLPILGYLADAYGPPLLSLIAVWFFCPSYFINSIMVKDLQYNDITDFHVYGFAFTFCFIGLATSALYFSSLLTCAKIYPNQRGLAISFPVSCYGLSSLIGSQLLRLPFFKQDPNGKNLDLYNVFNFFGILYLLMGILNFVAGSLVMVEQEIIFTPEEEALLIESSCSSLAGSEENDEDEVDEEGILELSTQRSLIEPPNHHERFVLFLKDKSSWLLLVTLVLSIGPMESYQNNLGSILKVITSDTDLANQLSVMAASSTVSRLLVGGLSDYLSSPSRKYPLNRVWLLAILLLVGSIGQIGNNYLNGDGDLYHYVSMLNGASYGGMFTLYPTIVASIWGIDIMGSTWGACMIAPAIGSVSYSLAYGRKMDQSSDLSSYFILTGISLLLSMVLVIFIWKIIWWKRGYRLF